MNLKSLQNFLQSQGSKFISRLSSALVLLKLILQHFQTPKCCYGLIFLDRTTTTFHHSDSSLSAFSRKYTLDYRCLQDIIVCISKHDNNAFVSYSKCFVEASKTFQHDRASGIDLSYLMIAFVFCGGCCFLFCFAFLIVCSFLVHWFCFFSCF